MHVVVRRWISSDVLGLLEIFGRASGSHLTDSVREREGGRGQARTDGAKSLLDDLTVELNRYLPEPVELYVTKDKKWRRSTEACHTLVEAVEHVQRIRREHEREEEDRRKLEWLQLASILDRLPDGQRRPVRIGAYQAHVERFWGRVVQELQAQFPWLLVETTMYPNRKREQGMKGELARAFEDHKVDYMLAPEDTKPPETTESGRRCYCYSLCVVGSPAVLNEMKGQHRWVEIEAFQGRTLIAAPKGYSSRDRFDGFLRERSVQVQGVIEDTSPLMLRVRALGGAGVAVLSDEYKAIGGAEHRYPALWINARTHRVDMYLWSHTGQNKGVHQAFDFVVDQLIKLEDDPSLERPAALR